MKKSPSSPWLRFLAIVAIVFILLPLLSIFIRAPWSDLGNLLGQKQMRDALGVSLYTSLIAAVITTILGVPLAWVFARSSTKFVNVIRAMCITPMVLPPVVGGIALLTSFGRRGILGKYLYDWWGISIPFTRTAVVMAQVFVALPFLVLTVESAFRQLDTGLEDAARTLGASRTRIFGQVAVPSVRGAIAAGVALAWARSLGEFGASITFAGSFPGKTQTLPMAIYELVALDYRLSMVMSLVLVVISIAVLAILRDRWISGVSR